MTGTESVGTPSPRPRYKSRLLSAGLLAFSAVVSLAGIEIGVRLFVPPSGVENPLFEPSPECLFRLKPGASARLAAPAEAASPFVNFQISSQGLRDREFGAKQPNEFRIAMLGDSFTMGTAVPVEDTLPTLTEREFARAGYPNMTVMNLGTGGTGPWQQRCILRDRGFALKPDLVVHQIFMGNDLADTLSEFGRSTQAYTPMWEARLHQFRRMKFLQYRVDRWLELHSHAYGAARQVIGLRRYQEVLDALPFLRLPEDGLPLSAPRPPSLEQDLMSWYPDLSLAFDRMLETLREIQGDCAARGIGYMVLVVPAYAQVSGSAWNDAMQSVGDGAQYERGKGMSELVQRLGREAIPAIPITEALQAVADPDSLYFASDHHLTPNGNEIVATAIRDYLLNHYFREHPDARVVPRP